MNILKIKLLIFFLLFSFSMLVNPKFSSFSLYLVSVISTFDIKSFCICNIILSDSLKENLYIFYIYLKWLFAYYNKKCKKQLKKCTNHCKCLKWINCFPFLMYLLMCYFYPINNSIMQLYEVKLLLCTFKCKNAGKNVEIYQ